MAKISVSIDDELAAELRAEVGDAKVSPFVAEAVRNELARRRLGVFLDELGEELGPVEPEFLADARAAFDEVEAASASQKRTPPEPATAARGSGKAGAAGSAKKAAKSGATTSTAPKKGPATGRVVTASGARRRNG